MSKFIILCLLISSTSYSLQILNVKKKYSSSIVRLNKQTSLRLKPLDDNSNQSDLVDEKKFSPLTDLLKSTAITANKKELNSQTYVLLSLLFFVTAICSLDRVAMSVAIIPMGLELQYSEEVKGAISTIFSFGYLFGMIPVSSYIDILLLLSLLL